MIFSGKICLRYEFSKRYWFVLSYKEESDDVTDSDDVVEVAQEEEDAEAENRETVERVYKTRMGKKLGEIPN